MIKNIFIPIALYLIIWFASVSLLSAELLGLLKMPLYFEITCIYLPFGFITFLLIKLYFISKEENLKEESDD